MTTDNGTVRKFETGAKRDTAQDKLDFEGFLSPLVLERYAQYMHKHRKMADGSLRDSDNWQKGIPLSVYMKSTFRHFFDMWKEHRGLVTKDGLEEALCALLFNISGYLHEHLRSKAEEQPEVKTGTDPILKALLASRPQCPRRYSANVWEDRVHGLFKWVVTSTDITGNDARDEETGSCLTRRGAASSAEDCLRKATRVPT